MTTTYLAKLADVKAALAETTSTLDAVLTSCLAAATSIAERAAGVRDGGLRREVDAVEITGWYGAQSSRRLYLASRPIESVSEVIQLYRSATPDEFDAASAAGDAMQPDDYAIDSPDLGSLIRLKGLSWYAAIPHSIRVTYTAGFVDPAEATPPASAILPPDDLQRAVISQAVQIYNLRDKAGMRYVNSGDRQQGFSDESGPLPELLAATSRYRRLM